MSEIETQLRYALEQLAGLEGQVQNVGTHPYPRLDYRASTFRELLDKGRALVRNATTEGEHKALALTFADAIERCLVCFETEEIHARPDVTADALENLRKLHDEKVAPLLRDSR